MRFNNFKNNLISFCVVGKHNSATSNITKDINENKKTEASFISLKGSCVTCKTNKSHMVSDQTIKA